MSEAELGAVVQHGFWTAVVLALPLVLAATAAGALAGWLAARIGLTDGTVAIVVRALAVVLAVGVMIDGVRGETVGLARDLWARLAPTGQGRGP